MIVIAHDCREIRAQTNYTQLPAAAHPIYEIKIKVKIRRLRIKIRRIRIDILIITYL